MPSCMTKTITFNQDDLTALQNIFDAALKGQGMAILSHVANLSQKIITTPTDLVKLEGTAQPLNPSHAETIGK